jgi:hypothetical protein
MAAVCFLAFLAGGALQMHVASYTPAIHIHAPVHCCHPPTSYPAQDGTSKDPVMNFFGLKEADAPVLVAFEMAKNKKFRLREDLT